jgi:hypothetical protein
MPQDNVDRARLLLDQAIACYARPDASRMVFAKLDISSRAHSPQR